MDPLLFVHIPKTAGTSFRKGAECHLIKEKIIYDYGEESAETSPSVCEHIYHKEDVYEFYNEVRKNSISFMSGHFPASKYTSVFDVGNVITFIRDPLQRIVSEYNHLVRDNGYKKSFEEFYRSPQFINRQSRLLFGVPFDSIGFVGVTESYEQSIEMLNKKFQIDIPIYFLNLGKRKAREDYVLCPEITKELLLLNKLDISLYKQACRLFQQRWDMYKRALPFVRGRIVSVQKKKLVGWAVSDNTENPVDIEVWIGEGKVGIISATEHRPNLKALGMTRFGCVGFSMSLDNIKPGDKVRCLAAQTGQELVNSPFVVK